MLLNILRCRLTYWGQAETNAEACFIIALRPRKPEGSLGQTAQEGHFNSHTAPELCLSSFFSLLFCCCSCFSIVLVVGFHSLHYSHQLLPFFFKTD